MSFVKASALAVASVFASVALANEAGMATTPTEPVAGAAAPAAVEPKPEGVKAEHKAKKHKAKKLEAKTDAKATGEVKPEAKMTEPAPAIAPAK